MKHLWEFKHRYYCALNNYFNNETSSTFSSWTVFLEEEGDADMDLNLLFRWDWKRADKHRERDQDELELFIVGQSKGLFRSIVVRVKEEDEPAVRAWLKIRWAHMKDLWAGVTR